MGDAWALGQQSICIGGGHVGPHKEFHANACCGLPTHTFGFLDAKEHRVVTGPAGWKGTEALLQSATAMNDQCQGPILGVGPADIVIGQSWNG